MIIRKPDDFHVHLRDGELLKTVLPHTTQTFKRALVMPNLKRPIVEAADVWRYRDEIRRLSEDSGFEPLMTLKLTQDTTPALIEYARRDIVAVKYYPEGATTNSEGGVSDIMSLSETLRAIESCGLVLCVHAELASGFCLDREREFMPTIRWLHTSFPKLRIVVEHITTTDAIETVCCMGPEVAATITPHHLILTLDDVVGDKLQPHNFCKPIAKRPRDRYALLRAATSGNPKFFLGTDSAPHTQETKECSSGCAGCFTAPLAIPLLADIFYSAGALATLGDFTSAFGASFYKLPLNTEHVELVRVEWTVPDRYGSVVPFMAGRKIQHQIVMK